ncbi:MAG TPA: hypothetical protein VJH24_03900 [Candidatus Bilamarchaeaceae archaeon]|nr:hypothetical protein [Candidatus Bilamarchaeaceae archaeon]
MLAEIFKQHSMAKILEYLIEFPEIDFSKADVARECDLQWQTVNEVFPLLEKWGLVEKSRSIGRAELYKVNESSKALQYLHKFALQVAAVEADEIAGKHVMVAQAKR